MYTHMYIQIDTEQQTHILTYKQAQTNRQICTDKHTQTNINTYIIHILKYHIDTCIHIYKETYRKLESQGATKLGKKTIVFFYKFLIIFQKKSEADQAQDCNNNFQVYDYVFFCLYCCLFNQSIQKLRKAYIFNFTLILLLPIVFLHDEK